jgi:hypothetical protein
VLLDDVNPTMKYHYNATSVAKYPSDAAYSAATRSALAYIGPRIQGAGRLAIANNAAWVEYYSTGVDWLRFLSGQMDEMFLKWGGAAGESYRGEAQWTTQLNELKETERQGKIFIGKTQSVNTDQAAARYGYATMLLGRESRAAYSFGDSTAETPLFPEYLLPIGEPVAPEERLANGIHRRAFSAGVVLVNPTAGTQSLSLGGSYSGSGLSGVSSVAMAPHTGLVLTRDGAPAPEPTPEPTPDPTPEPEPTPEPTPTEPGKGHKKPRPKDTLLVASRVSRRAFSVSLKWTRVAQAQRYRVIRDGRRLGVTPKRSFVDRNVRAGARYRYRIVALGHRGGRLPLRTGSVHVRA